MIELMIKRLLGGVLTLWVVATLTFGLIRLLPGGPFDQEHRVSPVVQQNLEKKYHLDKPWLEQYGYFMWDLVQGDLGPSFTYQSRSVNDIVGEAFLYSLQIGWMALLLGSILGMFLGTLAGITRSLLLDGLLSFIGVSSLSTPSFIFGGGLV
ncbi:MAG: ABC transporter permease, partial [Cyanobacteria bacterium]|nr:ABC transporter permease [Cyanobacteriota bacterium]